MSEIVFFEQTTPLDFPSAGSRRFYLKADGNWYALDSTGTETQVSGGSGGSGGYTAFQVGAGKTYATVQDAIDAAAAEAVSSGEHQQVHVAPGTYTEDLTLKSGVSLDALHPSLLPVVIGNHTFSFVAGFSAFHLGHLELQRADTATPHFSWSGAAGGGGLFFADCRFTDDAAAGTSDYIQFTSSSPGNSLYIQRCTIVTNTSGSAVHVQGDAGWAEITNCIQGFSAAGSNPGIRASNGLAAPSPAAILLHQCHLGFGVTADDNTTVFVDHCYVTNDTGTNVIAIDVASSVVLEHSQVDGAGPGTNAVGGSGALYFGVSGINGDVGPGITVGIGGGLEEVATRARLREVVSAGATALSPLDTNVAVDTGTAAGATEIRLADAAEVEGSLTAVLDSSGDAGTFPISVTSPASAVAGQGVIQYDNGGVLYRAVNGAWVPVPSVNVTPFTVGTGGWERYTSINSAIDAAKRLYDQSGLAQTVLVLPGTYTEDLLFVGGVNVCALGGVDFVHDGEALLVSRVVVRGKHAFSGAGDMELSVQGIMFVADVGTDVVLTYDNSAGGKFTSHVTFSGCHFYQKVSAAVPVLLATSRSAAGADRLDFVECYFLGDSTVDIVQLGGSAIEYSFRQCSIANMSNGFRGISVADSAILKLEDSLCPAISLADTSSAQAARTRVLSDSATAEVLTIGTNCSFSAYAGCSLHNPTTAGSVTAGTGVLFTHAPLAISVGSTVEGVEVTTRGVGLFGGGGQTKALVVGGGGGTLSITPDSGVVEIDSTLSAFTAELPSPVEAGPGRLVVLWDSTASAGANNVTVTTAGGTIVGTALLSSNGQRLTYMSDGVARWLLIGNET